MTQARPPSVNAPTFRLFRPSEDEMRRLSAADDAAPFSYPDVGSTRARGPTGWHFDFLEDQVGHGEKDWQSLTDAIRRWDMFDLDWVHLLAPGAPIEPGQNVTFSSFQLGLWVVNSCRIVYVVDEANDDEARFGFAYGTLPGHAVAGEELFLGRWDKRTDVVSFALRKFSRARHPLVRLAGPVARQVQRRFSRDAIDRMARSIQEATP